MKKPIIMWLLPLLCSLLAFAPRTALAATEYDLWVNNQQVTSDRLEIICGSGTATYDPGTNTLTLDGAQITQGCSLESLSSGILSRLDGLTIAVATQSSITNTGGEGVSTYHLDGEFKSIPHPLTITGPGKLIISEDTDWYGYGVYCTGDLTLEGAQLNITSAASGLWSEWGIDIWDSDVDIRVTTGFNGIVTNAGGNAAQGVTGSRRVAITNSDVDVLLTDDESYNNNAVLLCGQSTAGALVLNSGTVTLTGGKVGINGLAQGAAATVTVNGGSLNITTPGGTATNLSAFTLANGETITSGTLNGKSCVIGAGPAPVPGTARESGSVAVLYNSEGSIWLTGSDLPEKGLLLTRPISLDGCKALTGLSGKVGAYDIRVQGGPAFFGSPCICTSIFRRAMPPRRLPWPGKGRRGWNISMPWPTKTGTWPLARCIPFLPSCSLKVRWKARPNPSS